MRAAGIALLGVAIALGGSACKPIQGGLTGSTPTPSASASASAKPKPQPVSTNCDLTVPRHPLTAAGLATPYLLKATHKGAPCREANTDDSAFVQATIVDPATGRLSVYDPLVIDKGTKPAVKPVLPKLAKHAIVDILFGFNGDNLRLRGAHGSLRQGKCVNGIGASPFTQVAYCNGPAFFAAANKAIAQRKLRIPALGKGRDGKACMSARDFALIDQDQSDNVTTAYLALPGGRLAQATKANTRKLERRHAQQIDNGSDNRLLDAFVDPALKCTALTAPDLANARTPSTSQALNELQAAAGQRAPIALVPLNDPMTLLNGEYSYRKTNLYRVGVDQRPLTVKAERTDSPAAYCANMVNVGIARLKLDRKFFVKAPSADPAAATNLFTFMAQRLGASFGNLGCGALLKTKNPVHVTTNAAGVVTAVRFVQSSVRILRPTPGPLT
jgi:hypothetical protein